MNGRHSPVFTTREQAVLAADAEVETRASENEEELEEGLEGTFPASDPVSATNTSHAGGPDMRVDLSGARKTPSDKTEFPAEYHMHLSVSANHDECSHGTSPDCAN